MAVDYRGKRYDVGVVEAGVACVSTADLDGNVCAMITRDRFDKDIARVTEAKNRAIAARDAAQAELDALVQVETDLIALRATATADPA